jgi:hypothetical protein
MIFVPYFSNYSLVDGCPCPENNKYYASKSIEMARVSYLYIREFFGPDEHIYYSNGCSPIGTEYLTCFLPEKYEFIDSTSFSYNKEIKVHFKQFDKRLSQEQGVSRRIIDYLKFSWYNSLDYLAIDMDALVAYNLLEDFKGYDFGAHFININGRSISSYITYISANRLKEKDLIVSLPAYLDYVIETCKNDSEIIHVTLGGEGGYFRNFCYGKIKDMSYPTMGIHEPKKDKLIEFMEKYPVKHDFISKFLIDIKNKDIS